MSKRQIQVVFSGSSQKTLLLNENGAIVRIGWDDGCELKTNKYSDTQGVAAKLEHIDGEWIVTAAEDVYLCYNREVRLREVRIRMDRLLQLRRSIDGEIIAEMTFAIYEKKTSDYSLRIYLPAAQGENVRIGSDSSCHICLSGEGVANSAATLELRNHAWKLCSIKGAVAVNSADVQQETLISDRSFFSVGRYSFYLHQGCLYTSQNDGVKVSNLTWQLDLNQTSAMEYPVFKRSSRVRPQLLPGEIEVLPPKKKEEFRHQNVLLQVIPSIASLAMVIVLRGVIGGGGSYVLYSGCTMAMGIVVAHYTRKDEKKQFGLREENRREKYLDYIKNKTDEIVAARQRESMLLNRLFRPYEDNLEAVRNFDNGLFDRSPMDDDFMVVRMGVGALPASTAVKIVQQEYKETEDELIDLMESIEDKYRILENAPIVCNLRQASAIGVVGSKAGCYEVLKNITLDLAVRHYYKELRFFYILEENELQRYEWTRWLRNCWQEGDTLRNLIYDDESAKIHLESIYRILAAREENNDEGASDDRVFSTYYVIFVCDCERIRNHPLSQFFHKGRELGCTFVFFSCYEELIPHGCSQLIRLDATQHMGELVQCRQDDVSFNFKYPLIPDSIVEEVTKKLCPVSVVEANLESRLTKNITFFELLNVQNAQDIDIGAYWAHSNIENSMAVPLGVRTKNDIVYLDLHEKYHGPHGLVAGTTGSGKSEILQSYILSMAVHFSPEEVGFVVIDFKGGGMADQFANLPHLVGRITNIDGREVERSLKSIRAELERRQKLFSQYGTKEAPINSIGKYIHAHKTEPERVPIPLPHLIIVVDEFAELKSTYPDFMQELISAARIGRSLGVHLILATQKPSGVVDDQIWSNSRFKLCLKVQTREDSKEVLKTPLAAEIREPGRAYLQVGNNEIFELFQSAYSGERISDTTDNTSKFKLFEINPWGQKKLVFDNSPKRSENERTELIAVVDRICEYCDSNAIPRIQQVCLEPLKKELNLSDILAPIQEQTGVYATLGVVDDPEQHEQRSLILDITESNMIILGASQTGKTVLMITAIVSLALCYTPMDVQIYVIDGGNGVPKALESSHIVGGICYREEEERIGNLLAMLKREIAARRKRFQEARVGSFRAYKEAGYRDMPALWIMLDNAVSFKEYCGSLFDELLLMTREGNGAGIYFMVSTTQSTAIPGKIMVGFGTRLTLNCNDSNEYTTLFDRCRMQPLDTPGRGLVMINKRILEYQTAWFAQGETEQERNQATETILIERNMSYAGTKARAIPIVPEIIAEREFFQREKALPQYTIPIGMDYATVETTTLNLLEFWALPIVGRSRMGRTNFVRIILDYIQQTTLKNRTECYIVDNLQRPLGYCNEEYGFVSQYSIDNGDGVAYLQEIAEILEKRQDEIVQNKSSASEKALLAQCPLLLLVIENPDFAIEISKNAEAMKAVTQIKKLSRYKAMILVDNVENVSCSSSLSPDFLRRLQMEKNCILMEDLADSRMFDVKMSVARQYPNPLRVGDAYIYRAGTVAKKIHTVFCEDRG